MDHHHHRPTTRRQALGEINGNLRGGGNNNNKDAVKKGYVRKNALFRFLARKEALFLFLNHLSLEREMGDDGFFFSILSPLVLKGKVPRFSKSAHNLHFVYSSFYLYIITFYSTQNKAERFSNTEGTSEPDLVARRKRRFKVPLKIMAPTFPWRNHPEEGTKALTLDITTTTPTRKWTEERISSVDPLGWRSTIRCKRTRKT